jgi:hypothetical protein
MQCLVFAASNAKHSQAMQVYWQRIADESTQLLRLDLDVFLDIWEIGNGDRHWPGAPIASK